LQALLALSKDACSRALGEQQLCGSDSRKGYEGHPGHMLQTSRLTQGSTTAEL